MVSPIEAIKMALRNLLAHRLRSSLTMLGIIIGNSSVITMVGVGEGTKTYVTEQLQALGPDVLFVVPGSRDAQRTTFDLPKTLVFADAEAIANQVPSVKEVAPEVRLRELTTYRNRNTFSLIVGVTPSYLSVRSFEVGRGRFFGELDLKRNTQVVVLGPDLAQRLFQEQNPIGQSIRIKNLSFSVIGVMQPKGAVLGTNYDDLALVPITTMANRLVGRTSPYGMELSFMSITAKDENSMETAQFQIANLLRLRHKIIREDDFTVQSQKDLLDTLGTITSALTLTLTAIAAISLLVGGIGVMNIMLVSVSERTQEIGLCKAIGATRRDILLQFLIEAITLAALGGVVGTGLGVGGVMLIGRLTPLNASVAISSVVLSVGVSGGIGLIFGVVPAWQAAKLDPIVALRSA